MSKRFKLRKLIPWLLIILWMVVIFKFSAEQGNVSGGRSKQLAKTIQKSIKLLPNSLKNGKQGADKIEFIIRKTGHVTEYFVLSFLIIFSFSKTHMNRRFAYILAFLIPLVYAALDEYHQLFIPWRDGRPFDILIDSIGIILGISVYTLRVYLINKKNQKRISY